MVSLLVPHTLECMQLLNLRLLRRAVTMADSNIHTILERTAVYTSHGYAARVGAIVQGSDEKLGRTLQLLGSRNNLYYLVKQIVNIIRRALPVLCHPSVLGRTVDNGEIELFFRSVEVAHQVEHHFIHLLGTAVRLIHLVNYHDRFEPQLQSLLQDKARLRHRAFESIYEKEASVCHIEHTLHLTTEVGVTRSIENINLGSFPVDRHILRENGYTALTLQVIGVENLAAVILSVTEQFSCQHHLVHQSRFAMVDVCNNCNVSNVLHFLYLKAFTNMAAKLQKISQKLARTTKKL